MIIEDDDKCPGCQRHEMHKYCPAYGTAFYMSGVAYDVQIENRLIREVCYLGQEDAKYKPYNGSRFHSIRLQRSYDIGYEGVVHSAINWLLQHAKDPRWGIVAKAIETLKNKPD